MIEGKPPKALLCDDEVSLREWSVDDAGWYVESRDEDVFRWTTEKRDLTVAEAEEAIRRVNQSDTVFGFAIVRGDEILGNIALVIDEGNRCAGEAMYWLAPWGRERGVATRALTLLCDWAFEVVGLERVTLKAHQDNVRSQKVAERAGFEPLTERPNMPEDQTQLWYVRRRQ
jgi:RimJ/RimL family protein N-acetyltransferase